MRSKILREGTVYTVKYRKDVDGLRALAVLSVILMHGFSKIFSNGYLGVDIFFVISGFVITKSLLKRRNECFKDYIISFYSKRFRRILPAVALAILVTSIFICFLNPRPNDYLKTAIAASFGAGNLQLYFAGQNYFSQAATLNPFTHTWSLGVEEQFYLIAPLLLWLSIKYASIQTYFRLICGLLLISLIAWVWVGGQNQKAAFYLMQYRFWELATGVLIAIYTDHSDHHTTWIQKRLESGKIGAICIVVLTLICVLPFHLPRVPAYIAVVACMAIVLLSDTSATKIGKILTAAPVNLLGRASYSIYLWHWPLLVLSAWSFGRSVAITIFLIAMSIAFGIASMVFVENPIRFRMNLKPRATISAGLALMVITAMVPGLFGKLKPHIYLGTPPQMIAIGTPTLFNAFVAKDGSKWEGRPCILSSDRQVGKHLPVSSCTLGSAAPGKRHILVFGNSYSVSFVQAFAKIAEEFHVQITLTSSWGAAPVGGLANHTPWSKANDYYWTKVVPQQLNVLKPGDEVFLVSDLSDYMSISKRVPSKTISQVEAALTHFSDTLAKRGIDLVVLGPLPFIREANCDPAMAVPQWYAPNGSPCIYFSKDKTLLAQSDIRQMLNHMEASGRLKVTYLDSVFCPGEKCTFFGSDNTILYRDQFSHPSVEASLLSVPYIANSLGYHMVIRSAYHRSSRARRRGEVSALSRDAAP